jgi:hypothetical protein
MKTPTVHNLFDDVRIVGPTTLHKAAASRPSAAETPRRQTYVAPGPMMRAGARPSGVCEIACEGAKQVCYASPVPNFICDLGYNACLGLC